MAIDTRGKRASAVSFLKPWVVPGVDNTSLDGPERFAAAWGYAGSAPVDIIVAEAVHAHAADASAFGQIHALAIGSALHAHVVETVALGEESVAFAIDSALHDHAADAVAFGQLHTLAIDSALHDHGVDEVILVPNLQVVDALHDHAADNISLSQIHALAVNEALHGHAADAVTLSTSLIVGDALHDHLAAVATLSQDHIVTPAEALHDHAADNVNIGITHTFVVDDCLHLVSNDNPVFAQEHILVPIETLHDHSADVASVGTITGITIDDALHAHTSDSVLVSDFHAGIDFMTLAGYIQAQIRANLTDVTVARMRRIQTIDEGDFVNIRAPQFDQISERIGGGKFDLSWTYPIECYSWGETREEALDNSGALVNSVTAAIYGDQRIGGRVDVVRIVSGGEADDEGIPAFYRGQEIMVECETYEGA